ncbi:DUF1990 family protein [Pedococcus sp. 5OH_020]|uniref:DUF1990 family protein n=1 Tax=Pedococcus sp. 5OH_020 TaxID=2989814 RepID=UPI0022E9CEB8|nr:DUF1990 domain-containing protein [Pedococcus sp. 5OH_020]
MTMRLSDLSHLDLTYTPQGLTLESILPEGFQHLEVRRRLGSGDQAFRRASEAVLTFEPQRATGLRPLTSGSRAVEGVDVLNRLGPVPVPCRVVWMLDSPTRAGFGYGTLQGHPESGEEGFLVERHGEEVYAAVRAYSRPVAWWTRLGGPLTWRGQRWVALGYLWAVQRAVDRDRGRRKG